MKKHRGKGAPNCVYCFIQERTKATTRKPNDADLARCTAEWEGGGRKEPGHICNTCGAIFERKYNRHGRLVSDEMANLIEFITGKTPPEKH